MKLTRVTITGADDSTDVQQLIDLSLEFPFVEWAILVSRSQEGNPRFPSRTWIDKFLSTDSKLTGRDSIFRGINLATHVCGAWVRELLVGDLRWDDLPAILDSSKRVQINTHSLPHLLSYNGFLANLRDLPNKQFIFQLDGVNNHAAVAACVADLDDVAGLFDMSAGAGILPDQWPMITSKYPVYYGFAGGLGPDNVVEQLGQIQKAQFMRNADYPFWIDMERRVRTEDDSALDMVKVRSVLEQMSPFINQGVFSARLSQSQ